MDDKPPVKLQDALTSCGYDIITFKYNDNNIVNKIKNSNPDAVLISGSDYRINDKHSPTLPRQILRLGKPILGLCYGFQYLVKATGGKVCTHKDGKLHEYSRFLTIFDKSNMYKFTHHDYICEMSSEWKPLIYDSAKEQVWMAKDESKKIMGIQFHPELRKPSAQNFFPKWLEWALKGRQSKVN